MSMVALLVDLMACLMVVMSDVLMDRLDLMMADYLAACKVMISKYACQYKITKRRSNSLDYCIDVS